MKSSVTAAALVSFGSLAAASVSQQCPTNDICYSLNIPDNTASSGSGDIYFQLSAPTTYSWIGLGQGSQMAGANIFVMYTSGSGNNVTISPRLGTGEVMPQHDTSAQVTLLAGSGVSNGMMVANVKCSNCNSWSGGSMDFTASSASWIYAYKSGPELDTDDLSAGIRYHDASSRFTWDLTSAKGGSDVNPFVAASAASPTSSGATSSSSSAAQSTGTGISTSSPARTSFGAQPSGTTHHVIPLSSEPFGGDFVKAHHVIVTHGVLASLAFVALMPMGAILVRVGNFPGLVWVHTAIQSLALVIFLAAFGLGIYIASNLHYFSRAHPIIGLILFAWIVLQPIGGFLHHRFFKKTGRRSVFSYMHIFSGRAALLLGMINGGLGIQLAGGRVSRTDTIVYGVFAGIMGTLYIASIIFGEVRRKNRASPDSPAAPSVETSEARLGKPVSDTSS